MYLENVPCWSKFMVAIRDYSVWSNKLADSQPKHQRGWRCQRAKLIILTYRKLWPFHVLPTWIKLMSCTQKPLGWRYLRWRLSTGLPCLWSECQGRSWPGNWGNNDCAVPLHLPWGWPEWGGKQNWSGFSWIRVNNNI